MIVIDTFNLSLPNDFESRAQNIVNKIGTKLLQVEVKKNLRLTEFSLPAVSLTHDLSDETIATRIVKALTHELTILGGMHD